MHEKHIGFACTFILALALMGCTNDRNARSSEPSALASSSGPVLTLDPATTGSISGTVKLEGAPSPARHINMSSEPECQKTHPTPVDFPEVVAGDRGALANVVVYIRSGLGNYHFKAPSVPAILDQKGCMYEPHVVGLMVNQPLEIKNSDATIHNVHPIPEANRGWNQSQPPGASPIEKSFSKPELAIPVMCNVHPWMRGYIFVFNNPYFSITPRAGRFELKNLPPGTYTIEAWQEKYGILDRTVTIGPRESKSVAFTFKAASPPR